MSLSGAAITSNYRQCLELALHLLSLKQQQRGFSPDKNYSDQLELAQSAIADENIVKLIQSEPFDEKKYGPTLRSALDETRRLLFPEVRKKHFSSVEQGNLDAFLLVSSPADNPGRDQKAIPDADALLRSLNQNCSPACYAYLKNKLLPQTGDWQSALQRLIDISGANSLKNKFRIIEEKTALLRRLYPDGKINPVGKIDGRDHLSNTQIIDCYKAVYCGIERRFPPGFLSKGKHKRAAIMIHYLLDHILHEDPEKLLTSIDATFFIRNHLQNVYRLFNYSANRVLRNAYPRRIPVWFSSRTPKKYWADKKNRVAAVRWLVEKRLNLEPQECRKAGVNREQFASNGLSFMFNTYYNSVSKALSEAYPELLPWELGSVPLEFWDDDNAAEAIRWLIAKKGWVVDNLPALVRQGTLNRKSFTEFGLATLFEKKFSRNLYAAFSHAYPGRFQPWEFGNVSRAFWHDRKNIFRASRWIARNEGIAEGEITEAVRRKRLNFKILKKYSIGAVLRRLSGGRIDFLFTPYFVEEHVQFVREQKLTRKLRALIRAEKNQRGLSYLLLYGIFAPAVKHVSDDYAGRYARMLRRIERRRLD